MIYLVNLENYIRFYHLGILLVSYCYVDIATSNQDCMDTHLGCTSDHIEPFSDLFANVKNCQNNPITRTYCKKTCKLCGKFIFKIDDYTVF